MADAPIDVARSLYEPLDAIASALAPGEALPRQAIDLVFDAGLGSLLTPAAVGGRERPLPELVEVWEELSRADASIGWCTFAADGVTTYFGAYLADDGVADVFADGIPVMAGQFAPNGTATEDGDDFVIDGDYQFGSGILHASWAGGGVLTVPEGEDESPGLLFACFPADQVELKGNWHVLGLQATASVDYALRGVRVPRRHTFDFFAPTVHRGGPRFAMGVMPLTAVGHSGWALGVTRRMLDELVAVAGRTRLGAASPLAGSDRFLFELGNLESRYRAGRAWVLEVVAAADAEAERDGAITPMTDALLRESCRFVNQTGADIARQAYLLAGTAALRDGPLQRCFRDLHAGSQHFFSSPPAALDLARQLLP